MFVPVNLPSVKPYPGDYIRYTDEHGNQVGCGILTKTVVHKRKPLTESYYVLYNKSTKSYWRVYCHRYNFFVMRHRTKNDKFGDYLRSVVSSDSLQQTDTRFGGIL